jgi:hypothetical protein
MINIYNQHATGASIRAPEPVISGAGPSGAALVTVVIFAAVAGILAAGLHFAGSSRIAQARQEIRSDKAFFTAEAGIERAKAALRNGATNFASATNYGEGRFNVKVWNSASGSNLFIVRSTGIVETATRVIEAEVRMTPFQPESSDGTVCFYGDSNSLAFNNNKPHIDGQDYLLPSTFGGSTGTATTNVMPGVSSVLTNTLISGNSGNIVGDPPVTNGAGTYPETYWWQFLNRIMPYAKDYTTSSAMGTRTAPVITILPEGTETHISGNDDGAGILIVPATATLKVSGTFLFEGLIILVGDGRVDVTDAESTGTFDFFGSVLCLGDGLNLVLKGSAKWYYSSQALANLAKLQVPRQMDLISWKEIKPSSPDY